MATSSKSALDHIRKEFGIFHLTSFYEVAAFLSNAFESEGFEEIKQCPRCQNFYAVMCWHGQGALKDYSKMHYYLQKAAAQGYSTALYNLAFAYEDGEGVEKDYNKALEYAQLALEKKEPGVERTIERLRAKVQSYNTAAALNAKQKAK